MLEKVKLFVVHSTVHLVLYTLPRCLFALFVRLPVTLWELITMKRPFTYSFRREREVKVVATSTDSSARQRLLQLFGLSQPVHYSGPLYSGHIHTVLGAARIPDRVPYERELMDAEDGNPICLDWLHAPKDRAAKVKGIVLVVPGLGNYGQTPYIQRLARYCVAHDFHCCVLTPRGMGSAPLTTPNITCVTFTGDTRHTLRHCFTKSEIEKRFGAVLPLFVIGCSAGGNNMLKAISEEVEADAKEGGALYQGGFPVTAAIAMVPPTEMAVSAGMLRTKMGRALYAKPILIALRKYLKKHKDAILLASKGMSEEEKQKLPLIHVDSAAAMKQIKDLRDIDRYVVAPHFGYKDEKEYYAHGYTPDFIRRIPSTIPIMYVSCRDDPIAGYGVTTEQWQEVCNECPNVAYVEYPTGGHLGFLLSPLGEYTSPHCCMQSVPMEAIECVCDSLVKAK